MTAPMPPIDYAGLDPGIRELVRFLRERGFETSDSGDGVTKEQTEDTLDEPHVFMVVREPGNLLAETRRLYETFTAIGADPEDLSVQGSYDPANGVAVMMLLGVNDEELATLRARQ